MLTKELLDRALAPLVLYVDVLPYFVRSTGEVDYLLFRRRPDVVMPSVWQPACGKLKQGAGISASFVDQVQKKTGQRECRLTPIDYLNSYYDHYYDSVMMVPCAGAELSSQDIKLDESLHDAYDWIPYEEVPNRIRFRGQLAAFSVLKEALAR